MTPEELPVLKTLEAVEAEKKADVPVLFLAWHDRSPRRDAEIALKEVADKHDQKLRVFLVDARDNPALVEHFELGKNAALIGWYDGEVKIRRNKPWNTDVTGIAADLLALVPVPENGDEPEEESSPAGNGKPVTVTADNFVKDIIESPIPVIVDFWADWCQPCKMIAPILEKLAKEFAGKLRIAKIDVDANPALAQQFGVQSIPTLMFVKNGKIVGQNAGAVPEQALRGVVDQLLALEV